MNSTRISRYVWVVPCRTQQDCLFNEELDHRSELLAVTTDLDCHWYCVHECAAKHGEANVLKLELLAVLKKTELCTKLRKLDFRK